MRDLRGSVAHVIFSVFKRAISRLDRVSLEDISNKRTGPYIPCNGIVVGLEGRTRQI